MKKLSFYEVFKNKKPIIGMIHLTGETTEKKIKRAIYELFVYQHKGVDAAIIEDYHGNPEEVWRTFKEIQKEEFLDIKLGANILRNPYSAFRTFSHGSKFIQFDSVQTKDLSLKLYKKLRKAYSKKMIVLGGVGFKYTRPTGNSLEQDLGEAKSKCEAIVTTGEGTGIETPLDKLKQYKSILNDFPLIVGAGVNENNIYEQLKIADGAIIGTAFKKNHKTENIIDEIKVKDMMDIVREIRNNNP